MSGILQYAAYVGAGGTLDLKGFLNGEEEEPDTGVTDEDDALTILAWTDYDLDMMVDCYQEDYPDADIEIILAGNNGGGASKVFKNILQSDEQIDLYMAESSWIRSYIDDEKYAIGHHCSLGLVHKVIVAVEARILVRNEMYDSCFLGHIGTEESSYRPSYTWT